MEEGERQGQSPSCGPQPKLPRHRTRWLPAGDCSSCRSTAIFNYCSHWKLPEKDGMELLSPQTETTRIRKTGLPDGARRPGVGNTELHAWVAGGNLSTPTNKGHRPSASQGERKRKYVFNNAANGSENGLRKCCRS